MLTDTQRNNIEEIFQAAFEQKNNCYVYALQILKEFISEKEANIIIQKSYNNHIKNIKVF